MRKHIIKLFSVCVIGLFVVGCDDFLNTIPESSYSAAGSYQTQSDFEYAIAAVYAAQQNLYASNSSWFRLMIARSDDTRNGAGYTYGVDQFSDSDDVVTLTDCWKNLWTIISRCNLILEKIDPIEFADMNMKNSIKGEALTMRAWSYYTLGWLFGGMPLIDRELTVAETKTIVRSSQQETFDFAEKDYIEAIKLLPEEWIAEKKGRITRYAAEGGLARLYMFQSKFSEAKPHLANIINSGLYALEEEYINCFTDSRDNGKERVWEIQFSGNLGGEGQSFSTGMLPEGYKDGILMPFAGFSTAMMVSQNMVAAYEDGDIRKDISIVSNIRINGVIESKYYYILKYCHYDAYTPQTQSDWANNLPVLRFTDVKMMYAECLNEEAYVANGEALGILNEVRNRAGLPALTAATVPDQEAFRQALIKERRVEFAFEGLRWYDLVRWGIAREVMNQYFMDEDEGGGRYSMDGDYREIFAIPYEELSRYNDKNVMWQNPGY